MKKTKILISILFFLTISFFSVMADNPVSIISENENSYTIKCFHEGNLVTLYDKKGNKIYEEKCFNDYENFGKELFSNVNKVEIKNPPNVTDRYIRYTETVKDSKEKEYTTKKETFDNKYCFTVKTQTYSNIGIGGKTFKQVKEGYKCFKKSKVDKVIELKLDNKIIKTFEVSKKDNDVQIDLEKKGRLNEDYKNKVKVTFTKKTNKMKRLSVVDTNMKCPKDDFRLGKKFSMTCNIKKVLEKEKLLYYIQIRDNNKNSFYEEEELNIREDESNFLWKHKYVISFLLLLVAFLLGKYNKKVKNKDKNAYEKLEEDEDME